MVDLYFISVIAILFFCLQLRAALSEAERKLEESYSLPSYLQPWLQLTYDVESRYFETRRKSAEAQLKAAKEMVIYLQQLVVA
jgi:hypothetical protein